MTEALPDSCDYLVVGGGATGMAFVDSLLKGSSEKVSVVMLDKHDSPGGQWHDSYAFVQLHQPSASYGVESIPLEPNGDKVHRATRKQILDYYASVQHQLSNDYNFQFVANATLLDLNQEVAANGNNNTYTYTISTSNGGGDTQHAIKVNRRLVDARYLEPDLPISVPPKFDFDADKITCLPVNSLVSSNDDANTTNNSSKYYVVIGAGKTGMDGVYYLLTTLNIDPSHIVWVMPHDPWITARENIGNCMEFLQTAANKLDLQQTFLQWEKEGKIYRLGEDQPTKFKDATLSKDELTVLRQIPSNNMIRGQGRVAAIQDDGKLIMEDGTLLELPFAANGDGKAKAPTPNNTTYVHCSAGAFNYTKQIGVKEALPVFDTHRIIIQDVYGTPGFCFVGSIIGKLESIAWLKDEQRNSMCLAPAPTQPPSSKLGFTSGDVGNTLTKDHGYIQRLQNLKGWLSVPQLRDWLVGHRLFNLGHYRSAVHMDQLVQETWDALKRHDLV